MKALVLLNSLQQWSCLIQGNYCNKIFQVLIFVCFWYEQVLIFSWKKIAYQKKYACDVLNIVNGFL